MKINITTKFSGVSQTEARKLIEEWAKGELAKHGLSHLSVRIIGSNDLQIEGGSDADRKRAYTALGGDAPKESPTITLKRIDTSSGVISVPSFGNQGKTKPKQ